MINMLIDVIEYNRSDSYNIYAYKCDSYKIYEYICDSYKIYAYKIDHNDMKYLINLRITNAEE